MVKLRLSSLLATFALLICHMHSTHAAPARTSLESRSDQVTLKDYEAQRLLSAIVKEFMQMTSEEREQQATEVNSPDRPMSKRCTYLSTCVLGKLLQDIHKLQTYPRTNVGAGTPGKKRSLPEHYANYGDSFNLI